MKVVIAHLANPHSPTMGGAVRFSLNLLQYLYEKGVDVTYLGVQGAEKSSTASKYPFVPILKGSGSWYKYFINLLLKAPFLKIPKTAVVQTFRLEYMLVFVLFYPRNAKVFLQGALPLHYARLHLNKVFPLVSRVYQIIESFVLRRIDCLITNEAIKEYYVTRYPWVSGKIHVMPVSAVNLNKFRPMDKKKLRPKYGFSPEDKIIIFVGRLEKVKNLDFLFRSFTFVKKQDSKAKLLIVGRGSERPRLEKLSGALGLDEVIFAGQLALNKIPEVLNCADLLAMCSLYEGSPTVLREAIACGIPVVSTDVGDVREVIKKKLLGRIASRNEESFARALINVLHMDPEKVKQECRLASKAFGFDALAERVVNVYQSALSARNDQ